MRLQVAHRLIGFAGRAGRIETPLSTCRRCRRVAAVDGEWCAMEVLVAPREPVAFDYTVCPECTAVRERVRIGTSVSPFGAAR